MRAWEFSFSRAIRLLQFSLEALIVAGVAGRLLDYVRQPAWDHFEGRVYGALVISLAYAFPLVLLLQLCSLPFSSMRRFALRGLVRSFAYVVAMVAIVSIFGGVVP